MSLSLMTNSTPISFLSCRRSRLPVNFTAFSSAEMLRSIFHGTLVQTVTVVKKKKKNRTINQLVVKFQSTRDKHQEIGLLSQLATVKERKVFFAKMHQTSLDNGSGCSLMHTIYLYHTVHSRMTSKLHSEVFTFRFLSHLLLFVIQHLIITRVTRQTKSATMALLQCTIKCN